MATRARGMEIAMDIAFQCAPDHPWVAEHPEWFARRPDGSIQYAENPPKKYQDIYPLHFETADWKALWHALRDVFLHWAKEGVAIFRVDNPHTKPFAFWEWAIDEVKRAYPDTLFLAEAFTRPRVMHRLAKLGFTQSYTYFTWRSTKAELTQYFTELAQGEGARILPPELLAEHARHPSLPAAGRAAAGVLDPPHAGRDAFGELRHLWPRLRAGREPQPRQRLGGIPRQREVRAEALGSRPARQPRAARDVVEPRAPRAPRAAVEREPRLPRHRQRAADGVLQEERGRPRPRGREPRPAPRAVGLGHGRCRPPRPRTGMPIQVRDLLDGASYTWRAGANFVMLDPKRAPAHVFASPEWTSANTPRGNTRRWRPRSRAIRSGTWTRSSTRCT
jgi:starch synthase (maltosyl-transferring)